MADNTESKTKSTCLNHFEQYAEQHEENLKEYTDQYRAKTETNTNKYNRQYKTNKKEYTTLLSIKPAEQGQNQINKY
jgi:hypothetical protein